MRYYYIMQMKFRKVMRKAT